VIDIFVKNIPFGSYFLIFFGGIAALITGRATLIFPPALPD